MRLFIGLWPPDSVLDALIETQEALRRGVPPGSLRWANPQQLHLTLRFLGEVPTEQVPPLQTALARAAAACASLRLSAEGLGCFPTEDHPRVVWVGVTGDLSTLGALRENVAAAVADFAEKPEEREFHPHFTLARVRDIGSRVRRELTSAMAEVTFKPTSPWLVTSVRLAASELRSEGARYEVLAEMPLVNTR